MDQKTCTTGGDKRATRNAKNTRRDLQHYYKTNLRGNLFIFFYFFFCSFPFLEINCFSLRGGWGNRKEKEKSQIGGWTQEHCERLLFIFLHTNHFGTFLFLFFSSLFWEGGIPWDISSGKTGLPFILFFYKSLKTLESLMACKGGTVKQVNQTHLKVNGGALFTGKGRTPEGVYVLQLLLI